MIEEVNELDVYERDVRNRESRVHEVAYSFEVNYLKSVFYKAWMEAKMRCHITSCIFLDAEHVPILISLIKAFIRDGKAFPDKNRELLSRRYLLQKTGRDDMIVDGFHDLLADRNAGEVWEAEDADGKHKEFRLLCLGDASERLLKDIEDRVQEQLDMDAKDIADGVEDVTQPRNMYYFSDLTLCQTFLVCDILNQVMVESQRLRNLPVLRYEGGKFKEVINDVADHVRLWQGVI